MTNSPTDTAGLSAHSLVARLNAVPLTRLHLLFAAAVTAAIFFDVYEIFLAGTLSAVLKSDFGVTTDQLPPLLASSFLGAFLGAAVVGRLADRLGRRKMFMIALATYSLASLAAAFSPNVWFLILFRFIAGIGIGAETPLADAYLADMLPAKYRGKVMAWAFTIAFLAVPVVGFASRALVPTTILGLDGWRWVFIIGGLGAAVIWVARRNLPESPRWLAAKGRLDEADAIVSRFEASAPARAGSVAAGTEEEARSKYGREVLGDPTAAVEPPPTAPKHYTNKDLWRPPLRKRTIMLYVFHLLQGVGAYGFGTLVPLILVAKGHSITTSLTYSGLIYFGYSVGALVAVPIIERVERKWIIVGTLVAMAVLGLAFGFATNDLLIIAIGFGFTAANNILSTAYHTYQAEVFPTEIRASATGSVYSLSRLTTAAMPFLLIPVLYAGAATVIDASGKSQQIPTSSAIALVLVIVSAALIIVAINVGVLGPRTNGRTVEEIAAAE